MSLCCHQPCPAVPTFPVHPWLQFGHLPCLRKRESSCWPDLARGWDPGARHLLPRDSSANAPLSCSLQPGGGDSAGLAVPAPTGRGPRGALGVPGPVGLPWPWMIPGQGRSLPSHSQLPTAQPLGKWGSAMGALGMTPRSSPLDGAGLRWGKVPGMAPQPFPEHWPGSPHGREGMIYPPEHLPALGGAGCPCLPKWISLEKPGERANAEPQWGHNGVLSPWAGDIGPLSGTGRTTAAAAGGSELTRLPLPWPLCPPALCQGPMCHPLSQ